MTDQVPEVDLETVAAALGDGAVLVDVREPYEYEAGHVPGARLVPLSEIQGRLAEIPKGRPVYVICAVGQRSYAAAAWLRRNGVDAISVADGTEGWAADGRPIETGAAS
jgi:rhodanese-related sulfurtransferase